MAKKTSFIPQRFQYVVHYSVTNLSCPELGISQTNTPLADIPIPADDEAARIKAMFQANAEHWEETQERMSQSVLSLTFCNIVNRYLIGFFSPFVWHVL